MLRLLPLLALCACSEYGFEPQPGHNQFETAPELSTISVEETFNLIPNQKVDILWVVDNSCSMSGSKQDALAQNFPVIRDQIENTGWDWRMGAISTDVRNEDEGQGLLHRFGENLWSDSTTNTTAEEFTDTVVMGGGGYGAESGFDAVQMSFTRRGDPADYPGADGYNCYWNLNSDLNECFYRKDASLHVVVISDETDQSSIDHEEFVLWMRTLKPQDDQVSFSILGWGNTANYSLAADALGGFSGYIFGDWTESVPELTSLFTNSGLQFRLTEGWPYEPSIEVQIHNEEGTKNLQRGDCNDCYQYSGTIQNMITLSKYDAEENGVLTVKYTLLDSMLSQVGE